MENSEFRDGRDVESKYPCCVTQQGDDTCTRMMIFPPFFTEMIGFFVCCAIRLFIKKWRVFEVCDNS